MTEGIRYTGSKKEILPKILELTKKIGVKNILDGFSGTTRVSQMYKIHGYNVDCNDLAPYSKIFGMAYLINNKEGYYYQEKINYLNSLRGYYGWYSENYGGDGERKTSVAADGLKKPWQLHNTMKLDAIRNEIDKISENEVEWSVLLTSLIMALDKVDNTLGHQVAYLNEWSPRSYNKLIMKVPNLLCGGGNYNVLSDDIFHIKGEYDLIYLDPPYGTNNEKTKTTRVRYASYYHLWTTIIKNDKPHLVGKSKRRWEFSSDKLPGAVSVFESTNYDVVKKSISDLLKLNSKYFIFSYNNKSKVKISDLVDMFNEYKLLEIVEFSHKENIMKKLTSNGEWMGDGNENLEYLFLIEK